MADTVIVKTLVDGLGQKYKKRFLLHSSDGSVSDIVASDPSDTSAGTSVPSVASYTDRSAVMSGITTGTPSVASPGTQGYVPGNSITLTDGSVLAVVSTSVQSATVAAGGTGGTTGTQTVTGTTGTGTKFTASVTVASGAITAVGSITLAGAYTVNPTSVAAEPVTGGGLNGATLNLKMGVLSANLTTPATSTTTQTNPISQSTTTGSGVGATFNMTWNAVATQVMPANASRVRAYVGNPNAANDLWMTTNGSVPVANAAGTKRVFSNGGAYDWSGGGAPTTAIKVIGAAAFQPFTAEESNS